MRCNECGLCMSLDSECELVWQCNLTGDSWSGSLPADINRSCFAPVAAKAAFISRLLGAGDGLASNQKAAMMKVMSRE